MVPHGTVKVQVEPTPMKAEESREGGVAVKHLTEVKLLQPKNVYLSIEVMLFGMVTEVKFLHVINA